MSKYCFLDFEYASSSEPMVNTVCASWKLSDEDTIHNIWLYKDSKAKATLAGIFRQLNNDGYIFVAFAVTAEARSFIDIGLNPTEFRWCDLFVEWRQIRNCNDKYNYGRYFTNNMRRFSVPPNFKHKEENIGKNNTPLKFSLVGCCARLLKVNINAGAKTDMRNLILEAKDEYTQEEQQDILDYCDSDIKHLPQLLKIMTKVLTRYLRSTTSRMRKRQLKRGEFSADVAVMENNGIPIDMFAIKNLRRNVEMANNTLIEDLVYNHYPFFERKKKRVRDLIGVWVDKYKNFEKFIEDCPQIKIKDWKRTESGILCTDNEYLKKFEGIPEIKAYRETKKILGQLKWLRVPKEGDIDLFDSIGSDGRLRVFFGIYGTQTARNAPKARQFIFAMSAWLRCLVRPPKGYVITELDYASQEFAIAAILSNDKGMIEAYKSGDPYLYFAKKAKAVPEDVDPKLVKNPKLVPEKDRDIYWKYKEKRTLFKATTLGLQYGMASKSLALKLTSDMGRVVTEREAQKLIELHKRVYPTYWRWLKRIDTEYARKKFLILPCGWALLGDNPQTLSVRNFPTQGGGSSIIRHAVRKATQAGHELIATVHDSIDDISKVEDAEKSADVLEKIMIDSFNKMLGNKTDLKIRVDRTTHKAEDVWISEKGARFYYILEKYLSPQQTKEDVEAQIMDTVYAENEEEYDYQI